MKNFKYNVYDREDERNTKFSIDSDNELDALLECVRLAGEWAFGPDAGRVFFNADTGKWDVDPDSGILQDLSDYLADFKQPELSCSSLASIKKQVNVDYGWVITEIT
jgi:hypothetical protein